jgi:hypothetical protein
MPKPRRGRKRKSGWTDPRRRETLLFVSKRKAPLDVVRVVRARVVDDAARSLRDARDSRERAKSAAADAHNREEETRSEAARRVAEEKKQASSASDLAQLAAFEVGNAIAIERAAQEARAAAKRAEEAARLEEEKRASLVEAEASLSIVEKHQEKHRVREERARDARIDEVAEDAFAARFGRKA